MPSCQENSDNYLWKNQNQSEKIEMVAPGIVIVKEQPSDDQDQERCSKSNDQLKLSINESESYV